MRQGTREAPLTPDAVALDKVQFLSVDRHHYHGAGALCGHTI